MQPRLVYCNLLDRSSADDARRGTYLNTKAVRRVNVVEWNSIHPRSAPNKFHSNIKFKFADLLTYIGELWRILTKVTFVYYYHNPAEGIRFSVPLI